MKKLWWRKLTYISWIFLFPLGLTVVFKTRNSCRLKWVTSFIHHFFLVLLMRLSSRTDQFLIEEKRNQRILAFESRSLGNMWWERGNQISNSSITWLVNDFLRRFFGWTAHFPFVWSEHSSDSKTEDGELDRVSRHSPKRGKKLTRYSLSYCFRLV